MWAGGDIIERYYLSSKKSFLLCILTECYMVLPAAPVSACRTKFSPGLRSLPAINIFLTVILAIILYPVKISYTKYQNRARLHKSGVHLILMIFFPAQFD